MSLKLLDPRLPRVPEPVGSLRLGSREVPLVLERRARARRYWLRLRADGAARVTIPRRGTQAEALRFVQRNLAWLNRQFQKMAACPKPPAEWRLGSDLWLRGERVQIVAESSGRIRAGAATFIVGDVAADLRPSLEGQLRDMAVRELPPRVQEFAARHGFVVKRVTVRDQKSRWGSCSRRGTISLNWRLVQAPDFVRDYIILHELAHLRQMNHSGRFWREVERLCPQYAEAERWLKSEGRLLL